MALWDSLFGWLKAPPTVPSRPSLADFTEAWEGRSLTPYKDIAGNWTVGVGHLLKSYEPLTPRTNAEVDALFAADLNHARQDVASLARLSSIESHQVDAMADFVFNLGTQALRTSTLLRYVNEGNLEAAAEEFKRWNKARDPRTGLLTESPGLTKRRSAERAMFLLGDYSGRP